ncbi:MAG: HupE/UreJ family protein [Ahrensia sp.]|nr:HupE/UreJ family protein [Ahrensia sp.]
MKKSLAALIALVSTPAFAHHPMAGRTPSTLSEGLLSGIGHPILGLDHLLFVVAVGVAAVVLGSRFVLPLVFVVATLLGTIVHVMAVDLPLVELVIALSVLTLGALLMLSISVPNAVYVGIFAIAGLFHGHAYGEAIFGAETTPLLAYLTGFGITQYAIAVVAGTVIVSAWGRMEQLANNVPARLAGAMVAGAGFLMVGEKAIGAVFPV